MKSRNIRLTIIFGTLALISIVSFQMYWVKKTYDIHQSKFNQDANMALYTVAGRLASFNNHQMANINPVRQISSTYFIVEVNDFIDENILELYLKQEFEKRNLLVDYEYAIHDCYENKMVYGKYIKLSDRGKRDQSIERGTFEKCEECVYYFGINFPEMTSFIVTDMNVWIISSLILISAIIFFAYALFTIFRQKKLSEIQNNFINNMTHEFKTPISTISISADVIKNEELTEEQARILNYATIISEQNDRLKEQVERVLEIADIDKKSPPLKMTSIGLNSLIRDIAESVRPLIEDRNGSLNIDLNAQNDKITADKAHLTNVLINLFENAVKFSHEKPEIRISTRNDKSNIVVGVEDNGVGIEKRYHKKIFQRFFRVPTGNLHDAKGFGLGLHYVSNIIKLHKWKISLKSQTGQGSTFEIFIPLN